MGILHKALWPNAEGIQWNPVLLSKQHSTPENHSAGVMLAPITRLTQAIILPRQMSYIMPLIVMSVYLHRYEIIVSCLTSICVILTPLTMLDTLTTYVTSQ